MSAKDRAANQQRWYDEGFQARVETTHRRSDNPYKVSEFGGGAHWLRGWDAANGASCGICLHPFEQHDRSVLVVTENGAVLLCDDCAEETGTEGMVRIRRLECGCYPGEPVWVAEGTPVACSAHGSAEPARGPDSATAGKSYGQKVGAS